MLRRYFSVMGLIATTAMVTCFMLPALISSASTFVVLFGVLVAILYAPLFWWWFKKVQRSFKESANA